MYWVKDLGIYDSEEFMMSKKCNISYTNEIIMIDIDILPFPYIIIFLQPPEIYLEVNDITNKRANNSNSDESLRDTVVDVWF